MSRAPIGLEETKGKFHLVCYSAAVIRNFSLPALLGLDSLSDHNAVINCKAGETWFTDKQGCDIKPRIAHVHMQMVQSRHGDHWYPPIGRFNNIMTKLGEHPLFVTWSLHLTHPLVARLPPMRQSDKRRQPPQRRPAPTLQRRLVILVWDPTKLALSVTVQLTNPQPYHHLILRMALQPRL